MKSFTLLEMLIVVLCSMISSFTYFFTDFFVIILMSQMDVAAINKATDEEVKAIVGMTARGDLIALRSFCAFQSAWDKDDDGTKRKKELIASIRRDDRISLLSTLEARMVMHMCLFYKKLVTINGRLKFSRGENYYTRV